MTIQNRALVLDLIEWIAAAPRTYAETMDAWRTSCPRLPVWEDALDHGFVARAYADGVPTVCATPAGLAYLGKHRRV